MAARGLYKATDGSWQHADANKGARFPYMLKDRERWTLMDGDRAMVVHPDRALTGCPGPNYAPYDNMTNSYG